VSFIFFIGVYVHRVIIGVIGELIKEKLNKEKKTKEKRKGERIMKLTYIKDITKIYVAVAKRRENI